MCNGHFVCVLLVVGFVGRERDKRNARNFFLSSECCVANLHWCLSMAILIIQCACETTDPQNSNASGSDQTITVSGFITVEH